MARARGVYSVRFAAIVRSLCIAALGVIGLSINADAQAWSEVRTPNFYLIGDAPEKEIRRSAARLEQFRETFRVLFPDVRLDGGIPTKVIVFKDAASYSSFKPKRPDGAVDEMIRGYFLTTENVNYITLSANSRPGSMGTVFHEYAHFLLDTNIGRSTLPPWLGEGLAEYFETLQVDDARESVTLGSPPAGHLTLLKRSRLIPFKNFLAESNSSLHRTGDENRSLFYAQAWALTHYLLHSAGTGNKDLASFIASIRQSDSSGRPVADMLPSDHDKLTLTLRQYIDQPLLPVRVVPLPGKLRSEAEAVSAPLSPAVAAAVLGDLLYHMGDAAGAETRLRAALHLDPHLAAAHRSLGLLLVRQRKFADARQHLEQAIRLDETDPLAHFNYAFAISQEFADEDNNVQEYTPEAAAQIRSALRRAIELKPDLSESYRLLAFVNLVRHEHLDEAERLLKTALSLRPGSQLLNLLLAKVFLRQERYPEAAGLAGRLAATAASPDIWAESNTVLRVVDQYNALKTAGSVDREASRVFGPLPPLILKRSALTDADVARYDEERQVNNINVYIDRPRFGEKQAVGYIDKINCTERGIRYVYRTPDESFELTSLGFSAVNMKILTEGESSFTFDCGTSLTKQLTVVTFDPSASLDGSARGRLLTVNFVPGYFRLKTLEDMARRRTVIIEDDRIFTSRTGRATRSLSPE